MGTDQIPKRLGIWSAALAAQYHITGRLPYCLHLATGIAPHKLDLNTNNAIDGSSLCFNN